MGNNSLAFLTNSILHILQELDNTGLNFLLLLLNPLGQPPTSWIQVLGLMFDFNKCVNKNNIQLVPYLQISFESRTLVHTKHIQNYLTHFIYLFCKYHLNATQSRTTNSATHTNILTVIITSTRCWRNVIRGVG